VEPPDRSASTAIGDPADRLTALVRTVDTWAHRNEAQLRLLLRMLLLPDEAGEPAFHRPARRLEFLDEWFDSPRPPLDEEAAGKLRNALALLFGVDPVVTSTDVCQISRTEAQEALTSAARALARAAFARDP